MTGKSALNYTGERYHPEQLNEIRQEHMHRYMWARGLVDGLDVIDLACGEGFGSATLAASARQVTGIDISDGAVRHAEARYRAQNLSFICADAVKLPLADRCADVVVSFETVEHLADQAGMMAEIRRVLRPGGFLVMSSPNTEVYSQRQGHVNELHAKELTRQEFENLLGEQFPALRLFGQRLSVASSILSCQGDAAGVASVFRDESTVEKSAREIPETMYYIGVAAANEDRLPALEASFLVSASYDVYWKLRDQMAGAGAQNDQLMQEVKALRGERGELVAMIDDLSAERDKLATKNMFLDEALTFAAENLAHADWEEHDTVRFFDSEYYLRNNPDVASAGVNPLLHYLRTGRHEGRLPKAAAHVPDNRAQAQQLPVTESEDERVVGTVAIGEMDAAAKRYSAIYRVSPALHSEDHMLAHFLKLSAEGGLKFYFKGGLADAEQLMTTIEGLGIDMENLRVLEFAAGYGRLTRHLQKLCDLTVSDIHPEAVEFVRKNCGCPAYLSSNDPEQLKIPGQFNIVAVISLFSHLPDRTFGRWLSALYALVAPGGYLIFTTIGESARAINAQIPTPGPDGYAFETGSEQIDLDTQDYGNSTVHPHYVGAQIGRIPGARLISYEAGLWWKYQDQYIVQKPA
ncbi:class I SAM-dependent methyltransferase [Mesorhizobium loti]|uniref:class I SAM-dependent methyltransferase n=1 Tax=Rhizobium loti TaxID=381 RepID=UPI00041CBCA3|nr:methyltransferase domain-containing protein [Mesorhizobium loti]